MSRRTSIGLDIIAGVHLLSAIATTVFFIVFKKASRLRRYALTGIVVSVIIWIMFLTANITGHIWQHKKALPSNLWDCIKERTLTPSVAPYRR